MTLVRYNGKNILYFDFRVRLFPGVNDLQEADVKSMLKHPLFKHRFDKKDLELLEEVEEKPKRGKKPKEDKRSVADMLSLIPEIFDAEMLKKVIEADGRKEVVDAAKKQLASLKPPAPNPDKIRPEEVRMS